MMRLDDETESLIWLFAHSLSRNVKQCRVVTDILSAVRTFTCDMQCIVFTIDSSSDLIEKVLIK